MNLPPKIQKSVKFHNFVELYLHLVFNKTLSNLATLMILRCFFYSGLLIFRAVMELRNSSNSAKSHEIHKNTQNTANFGRNLIKYTSVQHFWKLSQLLGWFTYRKLVNLSWNFITVTCEQRPETTRLRLCCKKLGTSHDVKGFAIGSFLERIVVERANDDLCQKNIKNPGLISAKLIDF